MNKKIWIIGAVMLLVGVGLGVAIIKVADFFTEPIDKPLEISTTTPSAAGVEEDGSDEAVVVEETEPTAVPEPEKVCGHTGALTILLTGADYDGGNPPFGADAIRVMKADFSNQSVDILTIPRDLLVYVNGIAPENQDERAIGESYHYEKLAINGSEKEKVETATNFLAQTLVDNFSLESNYYMTIQLNSVQAMVDAIGGVEVVLPEEITTERDVTFPAGKQILTGALATEYLRAIEPGGDGARQQRQNLFLDAFQEQVLSTETIKKAPELMDQFGDAITTDLSPKLITDLTCLMEKVTPETTHYHTIPGNLVSFDEEEKLLVIEDLDGLLAFIADIFD